MRLLRSRARAQAMPWFMGAIVLVIGSLGLIEDGMLLFAAHRRAELLAESAARAARASSIRCWHARTRRRRLRSTSARPSRPPVPMCCGSNPTRLLTPTPIPRQLLSRSVSQFRPRSCTHLASRPS